MGNCASKKSAKSFKFSAASKKIFQSKMEKDHEIHSKGAFKKVVPLTKGEIKSFGFKKKIPSQLPIPVTLTSNSISNSFLDINENNNHSVTKQNNFSEGYQSGSSVESLCHAPVRSTSKTMQKKSIDQQHANQIPQQKISNFPSKKGNGLIQEKSSLQNKETFIASRENIDEQHSGASKNLPDPLVNRFGFRLSTSPKPTNLSGKNLPLPPSRNTYPIEQKPLDTNSVYGNQQKMLNFSTRSRSEGSRDSCQQNLKASHSNQSGLNDSGSFLPSELHPKKFTLQTSHLPKPQYPVRVFDTKTAKTAANYYRKEGIHKESNPSKEALCNKNSVIESHSKSGKAVEKNVDVFENSPGAKIRRSLPSHKGKKLELKVVGNKFELLKDDEEKDANVVTEISFIKLPSFSTNKNTAVINTGLVEERTNQYLKRISHPFANPKKEFDDVYRTSTKNSYVTAKKENGNEISRWDERCEAESEEEKSFKDSRKSEKLFNVEGCLDVDDAMLPGEAMAEDENFCFDFEDDFDPSLFKKKPEKTGFQCATDEAPNTIRLDALRLSKELKYKTFGSSNKNKQQQKNEKLSSIVVHLANDAQDEETFPSDSILEPLSSDSDSLGDKGENKNNDKEKNFKIRNLNLSLENLETEMDDDMIKRKGLEEDESKGDTDVDDDELDRNLDEADANVDKEKHNCLEKSNSSSSPGTPTNTSNSLSLSDGRDFLIDDEIADQPQLYFSEKFMEIVSRDEGKTSNEKLFMSAKDSGTCSESKTSSPGNGDKTFKKVRNDVAKDIKNYEVKEKKGSKLNSERTLSPCDSITSDDLMLDFESNSLEEVPESLGAFTNGNTIINAPLNDKNQKNISSQIFNKRSESQKSSKMKEESCHNSPTKNHLIASSPHGGSLRFKEDDDFVKIDKIAYQDVFQDVVSMKAMLLNLKCLLSKSEESVQENSKQEMENGFLDNDVEDELADLRRQVLFLQQQLEEREKTVQILKLKVSKTLECTFETGTTESREQCNAATQTGLDQFQKDFARFRLFRTTPVV